jgi:cob(I)alamin adenosyltransferase
MKIYTKTGDDGKTSLFRGGRVAKNNDRIEAYGTVDELNAVLGIAVSEISNKELVSLILIIQHDLFTIGADLATVENSEAGSAKIVRTSEKMIKSLEQLIDKYDTILPDLSNFILPGGTKGSSVLHYARTVCRRAERRVVELSNSANIGKNILIYLNRLSDLLFVLSRYENFVNNTPDVAWQR